MDSQKKKKSSTEDSLKKGRWIAMKTQEYGWLAGTIMRVNKQKITVRVERKISAAIPASFKSLKGWESCGPSVLTYFLKAHNCPRIVPMPFKKA